MKNTLKLEELAQFCLIAFMLYAAHMPWWVFLLLALGPDIGIPGYLVDTRVGAVCYNVLHHKGIAIALVIMGQAARYSTAYDGILGDLDEVFFITGVILYGHASMDRVFGYGLKYSDSFRRTHLGWIGGKSM